jgi:hemerythrin-like metal-binding protein
MHAPLLEHLALGIPAIDEDHRQMTEKLAALANAALARPSASSLRRAADELLQLTVRHFSSEEKLMESLEYPGLEHHRTQHVALRIELDQLCTDLIGQGERKNVARTLAFLNYWLEYHVDTSDRRLANWHIARRLSDGRATDGGPSPQPAGADAVAQQQADRSDPPPGHSGKEAAVPAETVTCADP